MLDFHSKTLRRSRRAHRQGRRIRPAKDFEKNVKAMLQSGLSRLDVVTREEFDTQAAVLAKTREKLEQLEARVAELEARKRRPRSRSLLSRDLVHTDERASRRPRRVSSRDVRGPLASESHVRRGRA